MFGLYIQAYILNLIDDRKEKAYMSCNSYTLNGFKFYMDIISKIKINVNNDFDGLTHKWAEHKKMSKNVSTKMNEIGYVRRSIRMAQCADELSFSYCNDCDKIYVKRCNLCRDRFCPTCNWRLSLQRYSKMQTLVNKLNNIYPDKTYSFITLTVKNCISSRLDQTLKLMSTSWNRLLQRDVARKGFLGWAKSVEITYNKSTNEFHPHYHILIMWSDKDNSKSIIKSWMKSVDKSGLVVSIHAQSAEIIRDKVEGGQSLAAAICETFKYAIKSKQLDEMPLLEFKKLVRAVSSKRLIAFGGVMREYLKDINLIPDDLSSESVELCKYCGSINLDEFIYKWSFGEDRYTPYELRKLNLD